jgi:hypothetical protein
MPKPILAYAQGLVYTLLHLMPSPYQKETLQALLGLFLEAKGQALPAHMLIASSNQPVPSVDFSISITGPPVR